MTQQVSMIQQALKCKHVQEIHFESCYGLYSGCQELMENFSFLR